MFVFLFLIFLIVPYAIICYILYRIVKKFDNNVSYPEMLIPFWNAFRIDKAALGKPDAYYFFWLSLIIVTIVNYEAKNYSGDSILMLASIGITALSQAIPTAFIAQKLGKNIWVFFLLMAIPSIINLLLGCIIGIIVLSILAFDKSKTLLQHDEEIANDPKVP